MNKKRILKTLSFASLAAATFFIAARATRFHLYQRKDPDIEAYVQENLEQIIHEQEKTLGITYPTERPIIQYTLPQEYRNGTTSGLYNIKVDTIYLPSGFLTKPEMDFSDFMATIATLNTTESVKKIIDHELAHFYCDKMREKILGKDYHFLMYSLFSEEIIANKLISEGIAKYFNKRMNGDDEKPFSFQYWPSHISEFTNRDVYQGGYTIVKPIIDQHGEKGIQFLLFNPPSPYELFTPEKYRERILASIAKLPEKTEPSFPPFRIQ